jgi:hypothetical protein
VDYLPLVLKQLTKHLENQVVEKTAEIVKESKVSRDVAKSDIKSELRRSRFTTQRDKNKLK